MANLIDSNDRTSVRNQFRLMRRTIPVTEQRAAEKRVASRVTQLNCFWRARHIGCYLACDGELRPDPIIARAWRMGKRVFAPVVGRDNIMSFREYRYNSALVPNRYNIPEPDLRSNAAISPTELDLVLTPLVAFDVRGNRLGMGAGFYDRCFANLRQRRHWRRPRLVGLAYETQRVQAIQPHSWDIPLAITVTDRHCYYHRQTISR